MIYRQVISAAIMLAIASPIFAQTEKRGEKSLQVPGSLSREEMPCSLMGSLALVLKSQGAKTDYVELMGTSGAAFRASLDDRWDFGSMDVSTGFDFLKLALEAYGYGFQRIPDGEKYVFDAVRRAVSAGIPAIGIVSGTADYGPLIGYVQALGEIVYRDYGTGETRYARPTPENASGVVVLTKQGQTLSQGEAMRNGLSHAVRLWKKTSEPGVAWGQAAYRKWIADLRSPSKIAALGAGFPLAAANKHILRQFQDARTQAVEYLKRHVNDLGPAAKPRLQKALKLYAASRDQLKACSAFAGLDVQGRAQQAKRIDAALAAEHKAIAEIEAALKAAK